MTAPNNEVPELTAEQHTALALVEAWNKDPKDHRINDMITVGGGFYAFRKAMSAHNKAVVQGDEDPKSLYEVLVPLIQKNPEFAATLAAHGDNPFEHRNSYQRIAGEAALDHETQGARDDRTRKDQGRKF